jgi:hypothetical protein
MKMIAALLICVSLTACNVPAPLENSVESFKKMMGMAFQPKGPPRPSPTPMSAEAAAGKANAELLAEMIQTTFNQKSVEDQSLFVSLVSSLNQGASLEGIYRGLVMGSRYRVLESNAKAASPDAIKFFASEMGELQAGMKMPTVFTRDNAKQFPTIDFPEGVSDNGPDHLDFSPTKDDNQEPTKKTAQDITAEMLQDFIGATPFTLKRVLADEVMKKIDEIKDSPADLAQWYATLTVRLSGANTDFGLPQRNTNDFDFHFRFAKTMAVDRVKWEVLNRYHRIINRVE